MKIEIEGKFQDYCDGCPFLEIVNMGEKYRTSNMKLHIAKTYIMCENMELCQQLWRRLSTIQNDPPDLMEQIAAICREKGISVDEAVEMFKQL